MFMCMHVHFIHITPKLHALVFAVPISEIFMLNLLSKEGWSICMAPLCTGTKMYPWDQNKSFLQMIHATFLWALTKTLHLGTIVSLRRKGILITEVVMFSKEWTSETRTHSWHECLLNTDSDESNVRVHGRDQTQVQSPYLWVLLRVIPVAALGHYFEQVSTQRMCHSIITPTSGTSTLDVCVKILRA
jgi:hypothetical protein